MHGQKNIKFGKPMLVTVIDLGDCAALIFSSSAFADYVM